MEKLVLEKKYSKKLYYSSFTMLIPLFYAFYCDFFFFAFLYFCGFLTSINYWKNPRYNLLRRIDITLVILGGMYHYKHCFFLEEWIYFIFYNISILFSLLSYCIGKFFTGNKYISSNCHLGVHFFGNVSNIILYYGLK